MMQKILLVLCFSSIVNSLTESEISLIKADLEREVAKMGTTKQEDIVSTILNSMNKEDKKSDHLENGEDEELYKLLLENTRPIQETQKRAESTRQLEDSLVKEIENDKEDVTKELLDAIIKNIEENKKRDVKEQIIEALIRNRKLIEKKSSPKDDAKKESGMSVKEIDTELSNLGLEGQSDDDIARSILNDLTKKNANGADTKVEETLGSKILTDDAIVATIKKDDDAKTESSTEESDVGDEVKKSEISTKESDTEEESLLQSLIKEELEKRLTEGNTNGIFRGLIKEVELKKKEVEDKLETKTPKDNAIVATIIKDDNAKKSEISTTESDTVDDEESLVQSLIKEELTKRLTDDAKKSEISTKESDAADHDESLLQSLIKEELEKRLTGEEKDSQTESENNQSDDTNEILRNLIKDVEMMKKEALMEQMEEKKDSSVDDFHYHENCQGDIWKTTTCQRVQAIGYCFKDSYKKRLEKYCHRACGYCRVPSPPACMKHPRGCCWDNSTFVRDGCPACEDSRVLKQLVCKRFKNACGNPGEPGSWMKLHCPATCAMCKVSEEHMLKMHSKPCEDKTHACTCTDCAEFPKFSKRYCCRTCTECKKPRLLRKLLL